MDIFQPVWNFFQNTSLWLTIPLCFVLFSVGLAVVEKLGFHTWYLVIILAAGAASLAAGLPLYFWPFLLGMLTAAAEIISKFGDDPLKAMRTPHALIYVALNGVVGAAALYVMALLVAGVKPTFEGVSHVDQLKYAVVAGLGAMLIMRSKLFNIKVGEEDVSFGPEQIVKILFRFLQSGIDRARAQVRYSFVKSKLNNIRFEAVRDYCETQLLAAQALDEDDKKEACLERIKEIADKQVPAQPDKIVTQLKSYELGYVLLNTMGENFVTEIFTPRPPDKIPTEWYIEAPTEDKQSATALPSFKVENKTLANFPFFEAKQEVVPYMAYGPNMLKSHMRSQLNWTEADGAEKLEKTNPTRCLLKDYRLAFNGIAPGEPPQAGVPNVVKNGGEVEGVLYQLPRVAFDFLRQREAGYHEMTVKVLKDGVETDAQLFVADESGPEVRPNPDLLRKMIDGANEHGLPEGYVSRLKALDVAAPAAVVPAGGPNGEKTI